MWHPVSRNFHLASPWTQALYPSITITLGTPSLWNKKESDSCASMSFFVGKAIIQTSTLHHTCTALFLTIDLVLENIVSVKKITDKRQYLSCP
jgi:hypothetical protein